MELNGQDGLNLRIEDRRKLPGLIAERLKKLVVDGTLRPGDSLPSEAEIARQFNVSKPTVREAIDQLRVMGIISVQQGKQSTVNPLNSSALEDFFHYAVSTYGNGLIDIMELRRGIEVEIASLAAARIDAEGIRTLQEITRQMEEGLDKPEAWLAADYAFHSTLARMSKNEMILQVYNGISDAVRYMQRVVHMQRDMRTPSITLQSHKDIAAAVMEGDQQRARETMLIHCSGGLPIIQAIVADESRRRGLF